MYTSGLLGQMNMMASSAGNWIRAGVFALGMGMVGGCADNGYYGPDEHVPPIDDPHEPPIPDTPIANLRACLPPDAAGDGFSVMVEATGARFGSGDPVNGLFRMSFPANDILPDTSSSGGGTISFRARGRWNNSPQEWLDGDDGTGIGPLANTAPRLSGEPFTHGGMTKPGITGTYGNAFATALGTDVSKLGFHWFLEGILHYTNSAGVVTCDRVEVLSLRSDARTTSGFSTPSMDYTVLSVYAPRSDGLTSMAEADWSNEFPVVLEGDVGVFNLLFSGAWATACGAGSCLDVNGVSNPSGGVRMRLIRNTASSAHSDGGVDGSGGGG